MIVIVGHVHCCYGYCCCPCLFCPLSLLVNYCRWLLLFVVDSWFLLAMIIVGYWSSLLFAVMSINMLVVVCVLVDCCLIVVACLLMVVDVCWLFL